MRAAGNKAKAEKKIQIAKEKKERRIQVATKRFPENMATTPVLGTESAKPNPKKRAAREDSGDDGFVTNSKRAHKDGENGDSKDDKEPLVLIRRDGRGDTDYDDDSDDNMLDRVKGPIKRLKHIVRDELIDDLKNGLLEKILEYLNNKILDEVLDELRDEIMEGEMDRLRAEVAEDIWETHQFQEKVMTKQDKFIEKVVDNLKEELIKKAHSSKTSIEKMD